MRNNGCGYDSCPCRGIHFISRYMGTSDYCIDGKRVDDADREREAARQAQEALDLAATMRTVKADVSKAVGIMERESPLFYGSGSNPVLF